jgi:alkanesulfonate monooxygenase SsuD/methylene tetrahydromethanopterin reductase-like flavin-dependent oxidoreductase (luciferase family)
MDVGIGLPALLADVTPELMIEWARRADVGPFSTVSTGELLTHPGYDAIVTMTAAAVVTTRVRIMSNVIPVPLHNAGVLAKQLATICRLSGGRVVLGAGIGGKKPVLFGITGDQAAHSNFPDFDAAPAPYVGRAARFEEQLELMRRIWLGESPLPGVPPVGPVPARSGGPEVLVGGFANAALERAARVADGVTIFEHGADIEKVAAYFSVASEAWKKVGRSAPRLVASCYFAVGPRAEEHKARYLDTHYGHLPPTSRAKVGAAIEVGDDRVRTVLRRLADIGADEAVFVPMGADIDQVEALAQLV